MEINLENFKKVKKKRKKVVDIAECLGYNVTRWRQVA